MFIFLYLFVKISMVVFMINFHKYGFLDVKRLNTIAFKIMKSTRLAISVLVPS